MKILKKHGNFSFAQWKIYVCSLCCMFITCSALAQKTPASPIKVLQNSNGDLSVVYRDNNFSISFDDANEINFILKEDFNGDVEYYTSNYYPEIKGKIRSIGKTNFEYYTDNYYPEIKGKLKSIGNLQIEYYTGNYYPEIKGLIKSIGNTSFEYYTDNYYPEIKGKIKSIGGRTIEYYTGDYYRELKGKIKSIKGSIN